MFGSKRTNSQTEQNRRDISDVRLRLRDCEVDIDTACSEARNNAEKIHKQAEEIRRLEEKIENICIAEDLLCIALFSGRQFPDSL